MIHARETEKDKVMKKQAYRGGSFQYSSLHRSHGEGGFEQRLEGNEGVNQMAV